MEYFLHLVRSAQDSAVPVLEEDRLSEAIRTAVAAPKLRTAVFPVDEIN